jgi:tripartite-type tricarboxylate transporter receptor subunit TctC
MKERFLASGVETVGSTPQQFAAAIKSESERLSSIFKKVGVGTGK